MTRPQPAIGVRFAGIGSAVPKRLLTNADLEQLMDTSDEWIFQRTGIRERHIHDPDAGEGTAPLGAEALRKAMAHAGVAAGELDIIIAATMTPDMPTPGVACMIADRLGAGQIPAFDISAACSGFVYALNVAESMMRSGGYRTVGLVGADCLSRHADYSTFGRATSILFGDAAGAAVLRRTDDATKGLLAQIMHSDGGGARHLYIPTHRCHMTPGDEYDERKMGVVQMHGPAVFKFAVGTFPNLIEETLNRARLTADDIDHYVCHQSNSRILEAARERFGLPREKLLVNIDRYGNSVAASCPLVLDELNRSGRLREGNKVMFLAFGAGLTWASSLWQF
ncbi:MAG: ketoacyl-ACP synthase III [Phycisphaeraceae bacterium]|nr:ketoacyl-ACP synthase III [Phycisphaeraceae bacterium]